MLKAPPAPSTTPDQPRGGAETGRPAVASWRSALRRHGAFAGLAMGAYMSALDGSIVSSMLPIVREALELDVATVQWVLTIQMLIQSGLMLSFGRLGDLLGHKKVFTVGFVVFIFGAFLSGLAGTPAMLIGARAVSALGSAMLWSNSSAILVQVFPAEQRGRALGLQGAMVYLGLSTGPVLGGWLTGALGWQWVFWANIPFALCALVLSVRYIRRLEPARGGERFDLAGAAVYMGGLATLLLGLNQGHAWGWGSPLLLGCIATGLALLFVFITIERRIASPMLDLGLFRDRTFSASTLSAVLNYLAASASVFLIPFYLIQGRGLDPAQVGLILFPKPVVMAITTTLSGTLSDRIGSRLPATLGLLTQAVGLLLLSRIDTETPLVVVAAMLAVTGLGHGLFSSPNSSAVMGSAPSGRRGVAAGVLSTARTLGNVMGIGVAGAILSTILAGAGNEDPSTIVQAVGIGLLVACAAALVGALISGGRPSMRRHKDGRR